MSEETETKLPVAAATDCSAPLRPFDVGLGLMEAMTLISRAVPILLKSSCQWSEDVDGNWDTACGETFTFTDGGPKENKARWCPYCGGELVAVPYPQNSNSTR